MEKFQPFQRPQSAPDWEVRRTTITRLYASNELKGMMRIMEEKEGFKATYVPEILFNLAENRPRNSDYFPLRENQYKRKLREWALDHKRIKDREYKAMIRKQRERNQNDSAKGTTFRLRGVEVDESKIASFKKRNNVNDDDSLSDYGKLLQS